MIEKENLQIDKLEEMLVEIEILYFEEHLSIKEAVMMIKEKKDGK